MSSTYKELKDWINEEPGKRILGCHLCEGTDKFCVLEMDDSRGAVCERHGVVVPNVEVTGLARLYAQGPVDCRVGGERS